jgi:hypothetical protein
MGVNISLPCRLENTTPFREAYRIAEHHMTEGFGGPRNLALFSTEGENDVYSRRPAVHGSSRGQHWSLEWGTVVDRTVFGYSLALRSQRTLGSLWYPALSCALLPSPVTALLETETRQIRPFMKFLKLFCR